MKNAVANHSPRALTAIAAVLALSAIPAASVASAQEAAPVAAPSLSLPQDVNGGSPAQTASSTSATPTTPTVTLPPEANQPPTVVLPATPPPAPVEAIAEPAALPAPARTATRAATRTTAAPATVTASTPPSVPTAQSNGTAADGALAEGAVPAVPAPIRADPAPAPAAATPAPDDQGTSLPVVGIAGLLAALGIAGLGIAAMRRRRNPYEEADYAPEAVAVEPGLAHVVDVAPAVVGGTFVEEPVRPAMPANYAPGPMAGASATTVLAASPLPETADERRDLLERMVAAEPDEDNPFTAHKGRLRRARVQLQHREHQEEQKARSQPFDFRSYRPPTQTATGPTTPARSDLVDA